jgi:hypothetical protein
VPCDSPPKPWLQLAVVCAKFFGKALSRVEAAERHNGEFEQPAGIKELTEAFEAIELASLSQEACIATGLKIATNRKSVSSA